MKPTELAMNAAMRAIPMSVEGEAYRQRLDDFQRGYLTGHAACVRRSSKEMIRLREKAKS